MVIKTAGPQHKVISGKDLPKVRGLLSSNQRGMAMIYFNKTGQGVKYIWVSWHELRELFRKGRVTVDNYKGRRARNYSQIVKLKDIVIEYFGDGTSRLHEVTRVYDVIKSLGIHPKDVIKYFDTPLT